MVVYIISGLNPLVLKLTVANISPYEILAHRMTFAFLLALIPVLFGKIKINLGIKDLIAIFPMIALYTLFFILQTLALETLPSTEAGILLAMCPILVVILATIFLKEKTNATQIIFILGSVCSVIFIMVMNGANPEAFDARGTVLMGFTVLSFALTTICLRRVAGKYPPHTLSLLLSGLGFVVYNIVLLGIRAYNEVTTPYFAYLADVRFLLAVIFLGCGSVFLTSFLSGYALKTVESSLAIVFANLSTVITIFAGVLLLSEVLFWYHVFGAIVIVLGVIGTNWFSNDAKTKRQKKRIKHAS